MATTSPRVSFVIPVKDDAARLARCLASIARNHAQAEIIVADNGSRDRSPQVAEEAGARVLPLPGLRVSELRNRAAATATGDILAFVDADHEIAQAWVPAAIDALAPERAGAAGALYTSPPDGTWVQRLYGALRGRTVGQHDVPWLGSGNLAVRRSVFERVKGFDESLEACEDVDFCQRVRAAGFRIIGDERLESVHVGDPPTLAALFRAERWRGRDNFRVTLRGPLSLREMPSLVIPIVDVFALVTMLLALIAALFVGPRALLLAGAAAGVIVVLSLLRMARMLTRAGRWSPVALAQTWLVALTYDAARALALVGRASHHRRVPLDPSAARRPAQ